MNTIEDQNEAVGRIRRIDVADEVFNVREKGVELINQLKTAGYTQQSIAIYLDTHAIYVSHWLTAKKKMSMETYRMLEAMWEEHKLGQIDLEELKNRNRQVRNKVTIVAGQNQLRAMNKQFDNFLHWTPFQKAIAFLKMIGLTQEDISVLLDCHQPSISQAISKGKPSKPLLKSLVIFFKDNIPDEALENFGAFGLQLMYDLEEELSNCDSEEDPEPALNLGLK